MWKTVVRPKPEPAMEAIPKRYKEAKGGFDSFEEASDFIGSHCIYCTNQGERGTETECKDLHNLCLAMGNNFPMWTKAFIKLERKRKPMFLPLDEGEIVSCINYILDPDKLPQKTLEYFDRISAEAARG